jgi:hypothetical protein
VAVSHIRRFPHRENPDGTYDSICGRCFKTVAIGVKQADLKQAEEDHICNGFELARVLRPADG